MVNNSSKLAAFLKKSAKTLQRFSLFLVHRIQNDTIFRVAASLSYTSLIAVVPLIAIGLAIFSAFPVFNDVKIQFQELILQYVVPNIEQEINQYFFDFINATAKLTTLGVVGIALTAVLMLSTIENSLNFIFKVYKPRSLKTKLTLYWTVITLGPLLLGATFSLRGYLYTLQRFMPEEFINAQFYFGSLLPAIFTILALIMLYVLVPNRKVKISDALVGSIVALFMSYLLRKFFGQVISASTTYKTLYGAMATIPVLLIWIYCSWVVVLFGAVVTAALGDFRMPEKTEGVFVQTYPSRYRKRKNKHYEKKFLQKEQK